MSFLGRAHVRLGNDLDQRRAAPVVVNVALRGGVREAFVHVLRGVFFHVQARDADAFAAPTKIELEPPAKRDRQLILRNLIALGQVRIEIILTGEARDGLHFQVERERSANRKLERAAIQHRQGSGQTQANGTNVRVGRIAEARRASAENLRIGGELDVYLEPDDGLILCQRAAYCAEFRLRDRSHLMRGV